MNRKIEVFPNILTMGNILCGFMAIVFISNMKIQTGVLLIFIGAFLDALDGKLARYLKTSSNFGIQLDSLADIVTFGIAPSFLLYSVYFERLGFAGIIFSSFPVLAGAYRLARYNVFADTGSKKDFSGLPIPINAVAIGSYIFFSYDLWGRIRFESMFFVMALLLPVLMVSTIKYVSFPKNSLRVNGKINVRMILFLLSGIMFMISAKKFFFPITWAYILFGLFKSIYIFTFKRDEIEDIVDPSLEK